MTDVNQLVGELKNLMSAGREKEFDVGRVLASLLDQHAHEQFGINTFAAFLKEKFEMNRRSATRYITKFNFGLAFSDHIEEIRKTSMTITELMYNIYARCGKDQVIPHLDGLSTMKIKTAFDISSSIAVAKGTKQMKTHRVTFSMTPEEYAEFEECTNDIMNGFEEIGCIKDAVMSAVRELRTEALAVINQA